MARLTHFALTGLAALTLAATGCEKQDAAPAGDKAPASKAAASKAPASKAAASKAPASKAAASGAHAGHDHAGHDHKQPAGPTAASKGAPAGAKVFFVEPKDGATVGQKVTVVFGAEGITVNKAGEHIQDNTKGHHHIIIDGKPMPQGQVVPKDDKHIHFGGGQTETELTLTPGKHTLTMQFADGAPLSYGPQMSSTITVTVK